MSKICHPNLVPRFSLLPSLAPYGWVGENPGNEVAVIPV